MGDGPRQQVIDLGIPDPGPLGGGSYTGPLVTKTLLFLGLRGGDAPDLDFGNASATRSGSTAPPVLNAYDKATGATLHSVVLDVPPTGSPMTYMLDGTQYLVLAYGTGNAVGLIALAAE